MITLRPYQQEAVDSILEALQAGKHPVCSLPTGSGKSLCIADLCHRLKGRVLVVTHRKELISQNERAAGLIDDRSIGAYSAGLGRRDIDSRVIFGGIQSVYNHIDQLQGQGKFRYVIWDEVHHGVSRPSEPSMATTLFNACPDAQRIGMTATPYRLRDGQIWAPKDAWFDTLAIHKTIYELTDQGYLCRLVGVQTAARPDLSHVRTRGGDFALGDLSQASCEESVVSAACDEILHLAPDRSHIMLFCVDRAHAQIVAEALRERGGAPEIILGNTPTDERDDILHRFKGGRIRYLINVSVLTTGFDSPNVDCVGILRATQSKSLLVQMAGRGCRLHQSKQNCLILDAGDNLRRHMPIDGITKMMRSPLLAEQEKEEKEREEAEREKQRQARHEALVAKGIDPLSLNNPDDYTLLLVTDCTYSLKTAKKYPTRRNLLVSYKCLTPSGGKRSVTQFVLLDYPGRPGLEAAAWFARRGLVKPIRAGSALSMAWNAPIPTEIIVAKKDRWDHIIMEHFDDAGTDES